MFTYLGELVYDRTRIFIVEKQVLEKIDDRIVFKPACLYRYPIIRNQKGFMRQHRYVTASCHNYIFIKNNNPLYLTPIPKSIRDIAEF